MKRMRRQVLFSVLATLLLVCLAGCGKKSIDVAAGVGVEFAGTNGKGTAEIVFENGTSADFIEELLESKKESVDDLQRLLLLGNAVTYEITPDKNLSNGDTVTLSISVDSGTLKDLGYKATPVSKEFTVEGLTVLTPIDAFEDVKVIFSGIAPNAEVERIESSINGRLEDATVSYSLDKGSQLALGEEITVTARLSGNSKYVLKETTKTFPVDGVDYYITDVDEIAPETMEEMKRIADEKWTEYVRRISDIGISYSGFDLVDTELWVSNEDCIHRTNTIYLIYMVTSETESHYFFYRFKDIIQHQDGSQEVSLAGTDTYPGPFDTVYVGKMRDSGFATMEELKAYTAQMRAGYCTLRK